MAGVEVGDVHVGGGRPLALIAGPCVLESRDHALEMSHALADIAARAGIGLIYKTSFDKANRSRGESPRGPGMREALPILAEVRERVGCPVLTDVHEPDQCAPVAEAVDVLQIPAFLSRQTDLLTAAGETGRPVNIKKGQFLAPWDMANVVAKVTATGNGDVMVCERGVCFGYNALVADMRGLPVMARQTGCPVVFDATHAVQQPGGQGTVSGGDRDFAPVLARAAAGVGVDAVFMEVHEDPDRAPSDGPNMLSLNHLPGILTPIIELDRVAKAHPVCLN